MRDMRVCLLITNRIQRMYRISDYNFYTVTVEWLVIVGLRGSYKAMKSCN